MNDVWLPADCNERSSQHEFRRLYLIPPMRMEGRRQKSSMLIDLRCRMVFQSLCGLGRDYRDRLSIYIRERGYYSSKSWPRRKILSEANQESFEMSETGIVLGILFDTRDMTWQLSEPKGSALIGSLQDLLDCKRPWKLKSWQNLTGKLKFLCKLWRPGSFFMEWFCFVRKHSWAGGVPAGKLNVMAGYSWQSWKGKSCQFFANVKSTFGANGYLLRCCRRNLRRTRCWSSLFLLSWAVSQG